MSESSPSAPSLRLSPRFKIIVGAAVATLLVAAGAGGTWLVRHFGKNPAAPAPASAAVAPVVDVTGLDPEIGEQIRSAQKEVEAEPGDAERWGKLGSALMVNRFHKEAIQCFAQAEELAPGDPRWPYLHGFVELPYDAGAALPKLRRGADLSDETNIAPRIRVMHLLLDRGEVDEAEPYFKSALASHPEEPRVLLAKGKLELARGNLDEALAALEKSAASLQTARASLAAIATIQQRKGDAEAAAAAAARAEELPQDPNQDDPWVLAIKQTAVGAEAMMEQANRLMKANRVTEAAMLLNQVVTRHPESVPAWQSLGWALLRNKNFFGAQRILKKAIELDPTVSESHFQLGNAYFLGALYGPASEAFRESIKLRPDYAPAHHNLGLCLESLEESEEAITEFREAVRLDPNFVDAFQRLGARLALEGRFAESIEPLNRALALRPGDAATVEMLERAKMRMGEPGK